MQTNRLIKVHMKETFESTFENMLLPCFERACKEMLRQVHSAVENGLAQSIEEMQVKLKQVCEIPAVFLAMDLMCIARRIT